MSTKLDVFAGASLQLHLSALHRYSVLDRITVELGANLIGLELDKRSEGIECAKRLPGSFAGPHHGFIKCHNLNHVAGEENEAFRLILDCGMRSGLPQNTKAADTDKSVLGAAIALIFAFGFAAPKVAEHQLPLGHVWKAKTLWLRKAGVLSTSPDHLW